jgi:signal transduction histidine kinase/DNA-binding response OmpR family regulator
MILIVDDKPENLFSLGKILEVNRFEVDSALSGEEALKKVLKNEYELIILDVQMPEMDGFEVAEALSGYSKAKHTPILFLSAVNIEKRFIFKGYETGAVDYLTKPVDADILMLKVKTFCKLYRQTKELIDIHKALQEEVEFRKHAQEEASQNAQKLRSTIEAIPQLAFSVKANGEIEYTNSQWLRYSNSLTQWPSIDEEDRQRFDEAWKKARETERPAEIEVRLKRPGISRSTWFLMRAIPLRENNMVLKWVGTFTDIDEQKEVEKKKDEFIGIASHELKTPLTSIKAYFQLIERTIRTVAGEDESISKYISKAAQQLDKLNQLIADLLDVSKIQRGRIQFNKTMFDFDHVLNTTVEGIQQMHPGYRIIKKGSANATVFGDANRIEQVIVNFLTNAIKYSPHAKDIDIDVRVNERNEVEVKVRDYGVGIPKEKQGKVFQKFYRAEDSDRFQGLGIGLYICSEVLKRHGGTYGVESEPGKGSVFYFTLPVAQPEQKTEP